MDSLQNSNCGLYVDVWLHRYNRCGIAGAMSSYRYWRHSISLFWIMSNWMRSSDKGVKAEKVLSRRAVDHNSLAIR